jgi:hypothetical protein
VKRRIGRHSDIGTDAMAETGETTSPPPVRQVTVHRRPQPELNIKQARESAEIACVTYRSASSHTSEAMPTARRRPTVELALTTASAGRTSNTVRLDGLTPRSQHVIAQRRWRHAENRHTARSGSPRLSPVIVFHLADRDQFVGRPKHLAFGVNTAPLSGLLMVDAHARWATISGTEDLQ